MSVAGTFTVEVAGIGLFKFRRRTMRDEFRIEAEISRLTEGVATPTETLAAMAQTVAPVKVLLEECPKGWNIDAMDPFDVESYRQLALVCSKLLEKEKFFRDSLRPGGAAAGQGAVAVAGVSVPAEV